METAQQRAMRSHGPLPAALHLWFLLPLAREKAKTKIFHFIFLGGIQIWKF